MTGINSIHLWYDVRKNIYRVDWIEAKELNYSNRTILESLPEDFVYWFSDQLSNYVENKIEHEFVKKNLFNSFIEKYSDYDNIKFKQRHFSEYCQKVL